MNRSLFPLLAALLACGVASALPAQSPPSSALVLQHVTVVDVRAGRLLANQSVVVENGRITSVGASARSPAGARIVEARGQYLIPGLWDMHVHAAWDSIDVLFAPLFVANGVTGVREMYGDMSVIRRWKKQTAAGEAWPRLLGAGHILDGPKPFWPGSTVAGTADAARHAVDSLQAAGADFIKVYTRLPHDAYVAALEESKRIGIPVAGHVPDAVSAGEASDLGQRAIEHLTGVSTACSTESDALRAERIAVATDTSAALLAAYARQTQRILATQDSTRCAALMARFVKNHTWQVPTLVVLRAFAFLNDSQFTADPRLRYMPDELVKGWDWRNDFRLKARTPEAWTNAKLSYQLSVRIVGAMHRAGVSLLAGTDVLNPFAFPGFSLHDELGLLVDAGLSPAEALRAATLSPAVFLEATDSLGTVEAGKRADLVLLDANPLADIRNTQKIRAVVLGGRLLDRPALDSLLAAAEALAHPRPNR